MYKKYVHVTHKGEKYANLDKILWFWKNDSVNMNKNPKRIRTGDLRYRSPILLLFSTKAIDTHYSTEHVNHNLFT